MKNKIIKGLFLAAVILPSASFAFTGSVSDSSAKKSADMSNQTQANIDKVKNLPENDGADSDIDFNAKQYATKKVDENTNNALSNTTKTADNVNQAKEGLSKAGKSLNNLF
jgi:hypothetical protein